MAKIEFKVKINPVLIKEQTDLSKCHVCGDVIYSDMNVLYIMPYVVGGKRLRGQKTDIKLCDSCSDIVTDLM